VASRYIDWEETTSPLANFAVSYEVLAGGEIVGTPVPASPDATAVPASVDATPFPTSTPELINISGTPARTLARVNLRNAADFNGGIITIVLFDVTVAIQARNARGNWLLVQTPNGQRGWIAARYLAWDTGEELAGFPVSTEVISPDASITPIADAATVIPPSGSIATAGAPGQEGGLSGTVLVATLNIRAAPDETSRKLVQARMKDLVFIEARNTRGDWLLIRTTGDVTYRGWVASRFVGWADDLTPLVNIPVSGEVIGDAP
jgi:SH3-like domain-containing protein